jgi:hypothetical protein
MELKNKKTVFAIFSRFRPCWHGLLYTVGVTADIMMILDIRTRWNEVKSRLKNRYEILTDEDLNLNLGKEYDLIQRLQRKLGKSKAEIFRMIGEA